MAVAAGAQDGFRFSEASLIARDLTPTVSGSVIKPGDISWDGAGARSTSEWTSTQPREMRTRQCICTPMYLHTNVFRDDAYLLDVDGARREEEFGADVLADECASQGLGDRIQFGRRKSNDDKTVRRE